MAGLLDGFGEFAKTPEGQGLLAAAFGGLAGARSGAPINSLGRAGLAGMQGYSGALDRQQQMAEAEQAKRARDMQMQSQQLQLEQMQAQAAKQKQMEELARKYATPSAPALPAIQGDAMLPDFLKSGILPSAGRPAQPAGFDYKGFSQELSRVDPLQGFEWSQRLAPKAADYKVVGNNLVQIGNEGVKPVFTAPEKPASKPAAILEYEYAKEQGYKGSFEQFQLSQKRAGASSVVNNLGDNLGLKPKDRFEMEGKLRGDYEAATKTDSEIVKTSQDIANLLKQGGALKDQAAIYKFAKSLDPEGAVREADYAAIVKTAGGLDYVTALFNKALTGEQLAPKQRKEMETLTASMADIARKRIAEKQSRTAKNARMYNLSPDNIFATQENDGWGIIGE